MRSSLVWGHRRWLLRPHSWVRICWELLGGVMVLYDFIWVPLQVFGPTYTDTHVILDYAVLIYWTLDILATFNTGFFEEDHLVLIRRRIAVRYCKTWLGFDITVSAVDWLGMLLNNADLNQVSFLRFLRILRLSKLLRIFKVVKRVMNITKRITNNEVLMFFGLVAQVLGLLAITHMIACGWFALSVIQEDNQTWLDSQSPRVDPNSLFLNYATSFYWGISQFHGGVPLQPITGLETAYTLIIAIFALVFISWFVAHMTNAIMNLQSLHRGRTVDMRVLMDFLQHSGASAQLSWRVRTYVENILLGQADERIGYEASVALLKSLPEHLLKDIHQEVRARHLEAHDFFSVAIENHPLVLRSICHDAFQQVAAEPDEVVFNDGDSCHRMIFVELGRLHYEPFRSLPEKITAMGTQFEPAQRVPDRRALKRFSWISEVALWAIWENTGKFIADAGCVLLALDAQELAKVCFFSKLVVDDAASYAAAFVVTANHVGCTDLGTAWSIEDVMLSCEHLFDDLSARSQISSPALAPTEGRIGASLDDGLATFESRSSAIKVSFRDLPEILGMAAPDSEELGSSVSV